MLAWALAADTPTIIARALNPPSKACFITLPPFGQENATLFIGSITGNKIKEASARRKRISGHLGGKIRINAGVPAGVSLPAGSACIETRGPPVNGPRAQARTPDRPALQYVRLVAEGAGRGCKRPSVVDALSTAARLPGRRPWALPARVRNAEAAVARYHLLHAHLESRQGAILVHDPSADIRQCAPRPLVSLACPRIEGHCSRHGSRDEYDSHLGLWGCGPWPSVSEPSC